MFDEPAGGFCKGQEVADVLKQVGDFADIAVVRRYKLLASIAAVHSWSHNGVSWAASGQAAFKLPLGVAALTR